MLHCVRVVGILQACKFQKIAVAAAVGLSVCLHPSTLVNWHQVSHIGRVVSANAFICCRQHSMPHSFLTKSTAQQDADDVLSCRLSVCLSVRPWSPMYQHLHAII